MGDDEVVGLGDQDAAQRRRRQGPADHEFARALDKAADLLEAT